MNRKDIFILLAPVAVFLIVGVVALSVAGLARQQIATSDSDEKFQAFVQNVESGKWQLSTDRWLEGMRRQHATTVAYEEAAARLRTLMLCLTGASLLGVVFQVGALMHVRKRLKGPCQQARQ